MRVVLGFVGGLIVGLLTVFPVGELLAVLGLSSNSRAWSMFIALLLLVGWPLLCGIVGVWVATRWGKHPPPEPSE